jgi:hypothetical protein
MLYKDVCQLQCHSPFKELVEWRLFLKNSGASCYCEVSFCLTGSGGLIEKYTRETPHSLTRSLNNAITSQLHCRSLQKCMLVIKIMQG